MDLVLPIACTLILLLVGWFVARPLLAGAPSQAALPATHTPVWQMHERKERLYTTIKELELDHSQEKLSDEDYRHQRQTLEAEALVLLEQLDQLNGGVENGDLLEQIEADIRTMRRAECSHCGQPRRAGDRFCPHCGRELPPESGAEPGGSDSTPDGV